MMNSYDAAADAELQAWLDEQEAAFQAEVAERKAKEKAALKAFNFEHAKHALKVQAYARAIGVCATGS